MGSRPSKGRHSNIQSTINPEETCQSVVMDNSRYAVVSLYNYPAGGPEHCSIRIGERLNVLSDDGDWWKVKSSATGKESYFPSSYTAKVFNRWRFEGISREKAEELLQLPYNQVGSFLIRDSQTRRGAYSLSVRRSATPCYGSVKHYRISELENGWLYISPSLTFVSLTNLVEHYSEVVDGLCCLLREPCFIQGSNNVPVLTGPVPIAVRKPSINWEDVDSSMLFGKEMEDKEDSLVSEGLREAISSYLFMTEEMNCDDFVDAWKT